MFDQFSNCSMFHLNNEHWIWLWALKPLKYLLPMGSGIQIGLTPVENPLICKWNKCCFCTRYSHSSKKTKTVGACPSGELNGKESHILGICFIKIGFMYVGILYIRKFSFTRYSGVRMLPYSRNFVHAGVFCFLYIPLSLKTILAWLGIPERNKLTKCFPYHPTHKNPYKEYVWCLF